MCVINEPSPAPAPSKGKEANRATRAARVYALALALMVCLPTVLAGFARWSWVGDLLAGFRVQTFAISLAAGILLLLFKHRRAAALPLIAAGWNAWLIAPCFLPSPAADVAEDVAEGAAGEHPARRLLFANVFVANERHEALLDLIASEDPDVILLVEVTPAWVRSLESLRERYPHFREAPQEGAFGIAIYSRLPMEFEQPTLVGDDRYPALAGVYREGDADVRLLGIHPPPPVEPLRAALRNAQLLAAAEMIADRKQGSAALLVGDFNSTPWSPGFIDALKASGQRDSRRGFGIQPTWPAQNWPLRIPIDHCLVSSNVTVIDRRVGPPIGSDHLPLIVDFRISQGLE